MKTILALALLLTSITLSASDINTTLDFSKLYANVNAGVYEMNVTFTEKTTSSESALVLSSYRDDGETYCITAANFEIGEMSFTITEPKTGWSKNVTKKIFASVSAASTDSSCTTTLEDLAGSQNLYAKIQIESPFVLPAAAPAGFDSVQVNLAPFNGYLYLKTNIEIKNDKLVVNPKGLFTPTSIMATNNEHASVSYFIYAKNHTDASFLSLGSGLILLDK